MRIKLLLIFLVLSVPACAQYTGEVHYTDMLISHDKIWALTASGHINVFDTHTNSLADTNIHSNSAIVSMALSKDGNIAIADQDKNIRVLDTRTRLFKTTGTSDQPVLTMVTASHNAIWLITAKGICSLPDKGCFMPGEEFRLNHQVRNWYFSRTPAVLIDSSDRIWVGGAYGEWGGSLYVFDTKSQVFLKPEMAAINIALDPVNTIFQAGADVYITSGLAHMMINSIILKFNDLKASVLLESKEYWKDTTMMGRLDPKAELKPMKMKVSVNGDYIGPAVYYPGDHHIYFYSDKGIFKGDPNDDLAQMQHWTRVASPELKWTYGQRDAAGAPMNVLKLLFGPNGRLYFLSTDQGIGMVDKGQAVMLR